MGSFYGSGTHTNACSHARSKASKAGGRYWAGDVSRSPRPRPGRLVRRQQSTPIQLGPPARFHDLRPGGVAMCRWRMWGGSSVRRGGIPWRRGRCPSTCTTRKTSAIGQHEGSRSSRRCVPRATMLANACTGRTSPRRSRTSTTKWGGGWTPPHSRGAQFVGRDQLAGTLSRERASQMISVGEHLSLALMGGSSTPPGLSCRTAKALKADGWREDYRRFVEREKRGVGSREVFGEPHGRRRLGSSRTDSIRRRVSSLSAGEGLGLSWKQGQGV